MNCMVLRIGVFFDGTGNNLLVNDIKGKKEGNVAKLLLNQLKTAG